LCVSVCTGVLQEVLPVATFFLKISIEPEVRKVLKLLSMSRYTTEESEHWEFSHHHGHSP
jgi:hypothetical protein